MDLNSLIANLMPLFVVLLATAGSAAAAGAQFKPGEAFPDLVLPSISDGKPLSVADFRGRKLVLHIWASW